jgi:hypothetical protein
MTERQKVSLATLASICLHLLVLGLIMIWTAFAPKADRSRPEDSKRLEVTLVPPKPTPTPALSQPASTPTPTPTPSQLAQSTPEPLPTPNPPSKPFLKKTFRLILDMAGLNRTEQAPDHPRFELEANSQAASELPARGNLSLPTQDGSRRLLEQQVYAFTSTDLLLGQVRPQTHEFSAKKEEKPIAEPSESEPSDSHENLPDTLQPTPVATPPPALNGFALGRPTPVPTKATPTPVPKTSVAVAPPPPKTMPAPRLKMPAPDFQPLRERTRIDGNITNRGKAGVAAIGNPVSRYKAEVSNLLGARWSEYVNQKADRLHQRVDLASAGEVIIHFFVTPEGKVQNVKVNSNTANDTSARIAILAATDAKIPPMPPEVFENISGGRIEMTVRFVGYDE